MFRSRAVVYQEVCPVFLDSLATPTQIAKKNEHYVNDQPVVLNINEKPAFMNTND